MFFKAFCCYKCWTYSIWLMIHWWCTWKKVWLIVIDCEGKITMENPVPLLAPTSNEACPTIRSCYFPLDGLSFRKCYNCLMKCRSSVEIVCNGTYHSLSKISQSHRLYVRCWLTLWWGHLLFNLTWRYSSFRMSLQFYHYFYFLFIVTVN